MRIFLLQSLFVLGGAVAVLAQAASVPEPYSVQYVRLRHQPLNSQRSTVDYNADPTLGPNDNEPNGQSIVGNPGGLPGVLSVPNFTRSFTAYGQTYPYTMIGNEPTLGHTTSLPVNLVPVSLQLLNPDGSTLTNVPVQQYLNLVVNSPNFANVDYGNGKGQFADAVQRAEFYNSMKQNWHTALQPPTVLDPVTITIPATVSVNIGGTIYNVATYELDAAPDGETVVLLLNLYFDEVVFPTLVNNEINAGNFTLNGLNVVFLPNTYLFGIDTSGVPSTCCELGFHTYFSDPTADPEPRWITIFASWVAPSYFSAAYSDVTAFSHEISESLNDPFINNIVPSWQFPGNASLCQNNLETGDPLEFTANPTFAIDLKINAADFIFHPQNEALLQWFEQLVPSDAYDGAYSYPYETSLTAPATLCQ